MAKALAGRNLSEASGVAQAFGRYESERVAYVNYQVEFARKLGNQFHYAPAPLAVLRDFVFDNTGILQKMVARDYLTDAEKMSMQLKELHIAGTGPEPARLRPPHCVSVSSSLMAARARWRERRPAARSLRGQPL